MPAPIAISIINQSPFDLPAYATPGAAGVDLRASIPSEITLAPLERRLIPTGISLEIPEGYEGQVRPRSGLAIRQGLTCLNTPGTIDSDYRGEIQVILINLSGDAQTIHPGDRIAQLVFTPVVQVVWKPVDQLSNSSRGAGGFGHTGKQ